MSKFCKSIVNNNWFDIFIIVVIVFTGILVGLETNKQFVAIYGELLTRLQHLVLFIFTVEMVLKVIAEGSRPWRYFYDPWNILDFLIVGSSLLDLMLTLNANFLPVVRLFRLIRILRVLRVLRLISVFDELQIIVGTLLKSIPSIGYIGMLLALIFYIYGTIGVLLFGDNDPIHFGSLPLAILTMFEVVILEDWVIMMRSNMYGCNAYGYDSEALKVFCTAPEQHPIIAPIFFISFVAFGTMIVLHLFIGVIMNSMHNAQNAQDEERLGNQKQLTVLNEIELVQRELREISNELAMISLRVEQETGNKL